MIVYNLKQVQNNLSKEICLVAVSKTKPKDLILELYNAGQRHFGENKVQELQEKYANLPKDIRWHMIGHLQTNKVKYIASFVHLIHAVDSLKLLNEINKQAAKNKRTIQVLLQQKIAQEDSKFGMNQEDIHQILAQDLATQFPNVNIVGLMGMASFTNNQVQIKQEFLQLKNSFLQAKEQQESIQILSMGMSADYLLAVECGSNMVRIGSTIFGARK